MTIFNEINNTGTQHFLVERISSMGSQVGGAVGIGNPLGLILLIAVVFVAFAGARVFTFSRAAGVSTFLGSVISLLLVRIGWLPSSTAYLMGILFIISVFIMLLDRG